MTTEAALMHFQEWKKTYRYWYVCIYVMHVCMDVCMYVCMYVMFGYRVTPAAGSGYIGLLVTKVGFIPIPHHHAFLPTYIPTEEGMSMAHGRYVGMYACRLGYILLTYMATYIHSGQ